MNALDWRPAERAPMDGMPFLLGTESGGIMLELFHWCSRTRKVTGCYSEITLATLKEEAPKEAFLWARPHAPLRQRQHDQCIERETSVEVAWRQVDDYAFDNPINEYRKRVTEAEPAIFERQHDHLAEGGAILAALDDAAFVERIDDMMKTPDDHSRVMMMRLIRLARLGAISAARDAERQQS